MRFNFKMRFRKILLQSIVSGIVGDLFICFLDMQRISNNDNLSVL